MLIAMKRAMVNRIGLVFRDPRTASFRTVGKRLAEDPLMDESD